MRWMPVSKFKWGLIAGAAIAVTAVAVVGTHYSDVRGLIGRTVAYFRDAGAWPFFTAMAVLPAVGFPISAFNAVAGPVFGPSMGVFTVIACAGLAIAVNLAG